MSTSPTTPLDAQGPAARPRPHAIPSLDGAPPLVVVRHLTKAYRGRPALSDLSLRLPAGRIVGLMGANGCGKTTLLKILAGLLTDYDGQVRIAGHAPGPASKARVTFLPDAGFLAAGLTAPRAIARFSRLFADFDADKARRLVDFFNLPLDHSLREMSRGMGEKLRVALGMSRRARVCLLDEPISGVVLLAGLMRVAAMGVIVVTPVVVMVQVAVDYWRSMYGRRGYLTLAVPVRGRVHFAVKALYACMMALVVGGVCLVGLVIWLVVFARSMGTTLGGLLEPLRVAADAAGPVKVIIFVTAVLIGIVTLVIEVGAVMSIGAQGRFNHLGLGAPAIGFVLLYVVSQLLGLVATLFLPVSVDVTTGDVTTQVMWPQFLEVIRTGAEARKVGVGAVAVGPLLAGALAWWAVRAIERHTSLR
ncbi:ATP-binding cassette domain-containing protein [Actinomyces israelii]|uniref:ATP-binding cassette domain-containing protein n=1 Tax=Actinomyces israelii TaxID=1659 RepID=UPI000A069B85